MPSEKNIIIVQRMSTAGAAPHAPGPPRHRSFHEVTVRRVVDETADSASFVLGVPDDLREEFRYEAGQFCRFRAAIDGEAHERCYSMSSAPAVDDELQVTVKRVAEGLVSNWFLDHVGEGSVLEVTPPAGLFQLDDAPDDLLLLAAGSGITPIFSILKQSLATTGRRARLLYANRDLDAVIFRAAIDRIAEGHPDRVSVVHHLDADRGVVDAEAVDRFLQGVDPLATTCFVCGPTPFMDLIEAALVRHRVPADRIHIERFTPEHTNDESASPGTTRRVGGEDVGGPDQACMLTIDLDGRTATTEHRPGTTILQAARQAGLAPPFSCEAGNCATCIAKLIEGTAAMRANNVLEADEVADGWLLTCQAVPTAPQVHVIYGED